MKHSRFSKEQISGYCRNSTRATAPTEPRPTLLKEIFMATGRTRRPVDARDAAEAAFKAATTKPTEPAPAPKGPLSVPGAKESVTLRIDQDVIAHFQNDGPGWQDRMNAALRKATGL
jgi:uncharacterized protein (DUF4415 family)